MLKHISSRGNSIDTGGEWEAANVNGLSVYSPLRMIISSGSNSGSPAAINTMHHIDITSNGNTAEFGESSIRGTGVAVSNNVRGVLAGYNGTDWTQLNYITIASLGNFEEFGDLTQRRSGTANGNSNYQALLSYPRSDRSFITNSGDNIAVAGRDRVHLTGSTSNVSTTGSMGQIYITSAADSSEITYANIETAYATDGSTKILIGEVAGAVLKETTAVDGIKIFFDSGNITSGDFVMYAIKE